MLPLVTSKYVHVTKKHVLIGWKQDMLIAAKLLKFGVALDKNVQCKVGSCLLTWFVFDQQNIHCTAVRRICGVLKLQRIILKSKCDVSEWEIPWYYWKLRKIFKTCADCADQKHVINLTFGLTVCFNGYQLQMFGNKTSHVCHPILEHVFCLLSMFWCNQRYFE